MHRPVIGGEQRAGRGGAPAPGDVQRPVAHQATLDRSRPFTLHRHPCRALAEPRTGYNRTEDRHGRFNLIHQPHSLLSFASTPPTAPRLITAIALSLQVTSWIGIGIDAGQSNRHYWSFLIDLRSNMARLKWLLSSMRDPVSYKPEHDVRQQFSWMANDILPG